MSRSKVADNNRTLPQKILVERLQRAELLPDQQQPESVLAGRRKLERNRAEIERIKRSMAPPLTIRALWDFGRPSPTYILRRGEHDKPGSLVGPGVPSVLTDGQTPFVVEPPFSGGTAKTGRRLAFARWLVHSRSSVDGASDGESDLVPPLRHRTGQGSGELWRERRALLRIRSCSIGWRSSSSIEAGASRKCIA